MTKKKRGDIYAKTLDLISRSRSKGLKQKDIENFLGISKSYCSEIISKMVSDGMVKRASQKGIGATVYLLEFYPGKLDGVFRVGLLKSSEYIPVMSFLMQYAESAGSEINFRFYDSTVEVLEDLRSGALEFALAPTNSLILSALLAIDLKICSGLSSGGSGIIFERNWKKNALLSTEVSSMISLSLRAGDSDVPDEIESFANPVDGSSRFLKEKYRAIAIWEPYFTIIKEEMKPDRVIDYTDVLDGFPCCSIATTKTFWTENRDPFRSAIPKFLKDEITGFEHKKWLAKAVGIVAETLGMKSEIIEKSLQSYNFSDKKIRREMLANMGISLSKRQEDEIFESGVLI